MSFAGLWDMHVASCLLCPAAPGLSIAWAKDIIVVLCAGEWPNLALFAVLGTGSTSASWGYYTCLLVNVCHHLAKDRARFSGNKANSNTLPKLCLVSSGKNSLAWQGAVGQLLHNLLFWAPFLAGCWLWRWVLRLCYHSLARLRHFCPLPDVV